MVAYTKQQFLIIFKLIELTMFLTKRLKKKIIKLTMRVKKLLNSKFYKQIYYRNELQINLRRLIKLRKNTFVRDTKYEKENFFSKDFDDPSEKNGMHNVTAIFCKNYEVCNGILSIPYIHEQLHYLCRECLSHFASRGGKGVLTYYVEKKKKINNSDPTEYIHEAPCCVCLEVTELISQPRCCHYTCVPCMSRMYFGDIRSSTPPPQFPYSEEVENDYLNDKYTKTEIKELYPEILNYKKQYNDWNFNGTIKFRNEKSLRQCPLCRA